MLKATIQALKTKDVRKKILFTLAIFVIYRLLIFVPVPMIDTDVLGTAFSGSGGVFGFADALSGGALKQFSIIALGVSPYITASIVIQLLQMDIIPVLSDWAKEGEVGKQKINQVTRYAALGLAFVQALALAYGLDYKTGYALFTDNSPLTMVYVSIIMTGGTALILWLADQITLKGIGNGTSMIIMAGIVSAFPQMVRDLIRKYLEGNEGFSAETVMNYVIFIGVMLVMVIIVIAVIFMQQSIRKIPIQYANRPSSGQFSGRQDSHIPLRLNSAGVIPVIFAATLLSVPATIASLFGGNNMWVNEIFNYTRPIGFIIYVALIYLFSFVYSFIQVSPEKISDNLKKQGSYIPGVRPGQETENYLSKVLLRITTLGSTYLVIIAVLPILFAMFTDIPSSVQIGGTSLLIVVGVAIETTKQIQTQTMQKNYRGFIKY